MIKFPSIPTLHAHRSSKPWAIIRTLRPRQWIKNFAVFAGLIFSGQLENPAAIVISIQAFLAFCAASSATYVLNDLFDIERDRMHPFKSKRPIAAGEVPIPLAIFLVIVLTIFSIIYAYSIAPAFFFAIVAYLVLQVFYSSYIKSLILLDVMAIAAGFVIRIYAGVWAIDAHLNVWFLLTVISFALFLAIGKRRSELTLMQGQAGKHRETLQHYPENLLDILTAMFANSTWLVYALFTFQLSQEQPIIARQRIVGFLDSLSLPYTDAKYLMITIPIVIYGVMRYLYIIYEKKEGESPERVLLTDKPLLITVTSWIVMVIGILYIFKR